MHSSAVKLSILACNLEGEFYKPGGLLSGKVVVELRQPSKVNGLRIEIVGRARTTWRVSVETDGQDQWVDTIGQEIYIATDFYVLGSETGPAIELPVGQSSYPFSYQIPLNLPSSFKNDSGTIRYTITAIFVRPWADDYKTEVDFPIRSDYDLNQKPQAFEPIEEEIHKSFCCLCICPWGKVHLTISVPSSGFVPGQMIPVTVKCENKSTVDVSKIRLYLRRNVKLYATTPKRSTREIDDTLRETTCDNPFRTTFEDHVTVHIVVPQLPPSGLVSCGIINLNYILKVVLCFSGMHYSVNRKFPILIGTIPLRNSSDTVSPNVVTAPTPSAPLLQNQPSDKKPFAVPSQSSDLSRPAAFSNQQYPSYSDSTELYPPHPPSYEASCSDALRHPAQGYGAINSSRNPPGYEKL